MLKRLSLIVLLAVVGVLALSGSALAQGPITPQHSEPTWQASYWNNRDLSGNPTLQRPDPVIDFDWGGGSPGSGIGSDDFSARWTRYIDTAGGAYRFTATADDGIRVSVDGRWIITDWSEHSVRTQSVDVSLASGHHLVVVEYFESGGLAVARVQWEPAQKPIQRWRGQYYNNKTHTGDPVLVRDDAQLDFNWGVDLPAPGVVNAEGFSVRWTRTLDLPAGNYRFRLTVDDGGRLWVNNHLLVDEWMDQAARTYTGDIYLPGGQTSVRVDYYENTGSAVAQLSWTTGGGSDVPPPPPGGEVVVDDTDPGFTRGGLASSWRGVDEGFGGHLTWTRNNDRQRADYNWARWYPNLAARRYEVYAFIPERYTTTGGARYWVSHAGGYTQRIVSQSAHSGQWVSLGTYSFRGTRQDYVSLADVTYEPYLTRLIGFDAVKWVPR